MIMLEFTNASNDQDDSTKLWVFPDEIAAVMERRVRPNPCERTVVEGALLFLRSGITLEVTTSVAEVVRMLGEVFEDTD